MNQQSYVPLKALAGTSTVHLQRKCGREMTKETCSRCASIKLPLQRKATDNDALNLVPPIVNDVLSSPGQPIDHTTRGLMEERLGYDFSDVRIHHDSRAAQSADAVAAKAYTVGKNVVFGQGHYAPATSEGKKLFAHELAHVVQQHIGPTCTSPSGRHEREADAISETISQPGNSEAIHEASKKSIARAPSESPRALIPHVTNLIEQRLIILLNHEREQLAAQSYAQALTRTAAAVAIIKPSGEIIYESVLSDNKLHAEEKLLPLVEKIVKPGDTVALAIDADAPCGPNSKACNVRVNKYRDDASRGSLRVYAVSSTTKSGTEAGAKTTVVFSRPPIEQRHLRPLSEFTRIRLPLLNEPKEASPSQVPPEPPTSTVAPQTGPQKTTSGGSTGSSPNSSTTVSPALRSAKVAIAVQEKIGKLTSQTPNIVRVAGLVKGALTVYSLVMQVESAFKLGKMLKSATEAIESNDFNRAENELRSVSDESVLRAAEQLRIHAADIVREEDGIYNSISLIELAILEDQLETTHDSERLFDLSSAANNFAVEVGSPIPSLRSSAHDIRLMASALHAIAKFCNEVVMNPSPDVLAIKAKIWSLSVSTEAAGNKLDNAAEDYEQALLFAGHLATGVQAIGHKANNAAWRISSERLMARLNEQVETGKSSLAPTSLQPNNRTTGSVRSRSKGDQTSDCRGSGICHTPTKDPTAIDRITDDMRSRDDKAVREWLEPK